MKIFIKSMIYSLFLAASLNIAPVMAGGHPGGQGGDNDGNSHSGDNPDPRGLAGRAYALKLELWARQMDFGRIARDSQTLRSRPNFDRPPFIHRPIR